MGQMFPPDAMCAPRKGHCRVLRLPTSRHRVMMSMGMVRGRRTRGGCATNRQGKERMEGTTRSAVGFARKPENKKYGKTWKSTVSETEQRIRRIREARPIKMAHYPTAQSTGAFGRRENGNSYGGKSNCFRRSNRQKPDGFSVRKQNHQWSWRGRRDNVMIMRKADVTVARFCQ